MMTKDQLLNQLKLTANNLHSISDAILRQLGVDDDVADRLESESLILELIVEEIQEKEWLQ